MAADDPVIDWHPEYKAAQEQHLREGRGYDDGYEAGMTHASEAHEEGFAQGFLAGLEAGKRWPKEGITT